MKCTPKPVTFVIGQTLEELPESEQETRIIDQEALTLTHEWRVYLHVVEGDPTNVISRVKVDFGDTFKRQRRWECNSFSRVEENPMIWKCFDSRQKVAGRVPISFNILGLGGTDLDVDFDPTLGSVEGEFREKQSWTHPYLNPIKLPYGRRFAKHEWFRDGEPFDAEYLPESMDWKKGDEGLDLNDSADSLGVPINTIISVELFNGDLGSKELNKLMKLSQQFVKYEEAIDALLNITDSDPPNRVRSNRLQIEGKSNREKHKTIASCSGSVDDLFSVMNPDNTTRYKLQFVKDHSDNLYIAQFSFAALPDDAYFKVYLQRFCTWFVHNSLRFREPKWFKSSRSSSEQIDFLFSHLIKDRFLEIELRKRQNGSEPLVGSVIHTENRRSVTDDDSLDTFTVYFNQVSSSSEVFLKRECPSPHFPCSKRGRGDSSPMMISLHDNPPLLFDVLLISELTKDNKYWTHVKLGELGNQLNSGKHNSKKARLEKLEEYFKARDKELCRVKSGGCGIEIFSRHDCDLKNKISLIMKGGKIVKLDRRDVCVPHENNLPTASDMLQCEAKLIVERLYGKETKFLTDDYVGIIDKLIDEIVGNDDCRFALLHDIFRVDKTVEKN